MTFTLTDALHIVAPPRASRGPVWCLTCMDDPTRCGCGDCPDDDEWKAPHTTGEQP